MTISMILEKEFPDVSFYQGTIDWDVMANKTDAVIIQFGRQLFSQKKVNSETFARALKIFGPKRLVDLVSLMTNYSSTAVLLDAFDIQLDPDQKPLLPMP